MGREPETFPVTVHRHTDRHTSCSSYRANTNIGLKSKSRKRISNNKSSRKEGAKVLVADSETAVVELLQQVVEGVEDKYLK